MNNFSTYYNFRFREDLNIFFSTIPDQSKFHEDNRNKEIYSIQYDRLSSKYKHLNFLTSDEKAKFGVALFFTVLTDMLCYTNYRYSYNKFRQLTRYPKFIGMCPGGCSYHYPPSEIFRAMNKIQMIQHLPLNQKRLQFRDTFNEGIPVMEIEIKNFFNENLSEIDGQTFWEQCKSEFPYLIQL